MHGFSGSGKTWLSQQLIPRLPAIRVRSDIERKRHYGLSETEESGARVGKGIYVPCERARIYETLATAAKSSLRLGQHVIVDAAFLNRKDRRLFQALAKRFGANFVIVDVHAEPGELLRRVQLRQSVAGDASEADANVLQYQVENAEPLEAEELDWTIAVATDADVDVGAVVSYIASQKARRRHE
jgi:predicted kinase